MKNYHQKIKRYVYHLLDPNGNVFYVGQTTDPAARLKKHAEKTPFVPVMKTVTAIEGTYLEAVALEQAEIAKFPKEQLTNKWRVRA
jgi:predicted GIY-YIG superfamily endonuclease